MTEMQSPLLGSDHEPATTASSASRRSTVVAAPSNGATGIAPGAAAAMGGILSARNIEIAATYILDGIHGRQIGYRLDSASLARYRLYHSTAWRAAFVVAALVHMLLVIFEKPDSFVR